MSRVIFENLTPEQTRTLADWFEGQGEQDCAAWFEIHEVKAPIVDVECGGCSETLSNGDVIVYCK